MEIRTEKTHTLVLTQDELNILRCFIGDALDEGTWEEWTGDDEREFIWELHNKAYENLFDRKIGD